MDASMHSWLEGREEDMVVVTMIDDFGFDRLEREAQASSVYYRLLDARTGRRSTALATNIEFKAWADYLGEPPLAAAFSPAWLMGR
jgi:DNA replication protein DnaC